MQANQRKQVADFADYLFQSLADLEGIEGDWRIEVRPYWLDNKTDYKNREYFTDKDKFIEHVAKIADKNRHVYVSINPRDGENGTKEFVPYAMKMIADLDFKNGHTYETRMEQLEAFPLKTSLLTNSGGGLQSWWSLDAPSDPEEATAIMNRIVAHFGTDKVKDATRLMRVPGTWNVKPEYVEPRKAKLISVNPEKRYSLAEFDKHLPAQERKSPRGFGHQMSEDTKVSTERNNYLTSLAGKLKNAGLADAGIRTALEVQNGIMCDPPLPQGEIDSLMTQVKKWNIYQDSTNGTHKVPKSQSPYSMLGQTPKGTLNNG